VVDLVIGADDFEAVNLTIASGVTLDNAGVVTISEFSQIDNLGVIRNNGTIHNLNELNNEGVIENNDTLNNRGGLGGGTIENNDTINNLGNGNVCDNLAIIDFNGSNEGIINNIGDIVFFEINACGIPGANGFYSDAYILFSGSSSNSGTVDASGIMRVHTVDDFTNYGTINLNDHAIITIRESSRIQNTGILNILGSIGGRGGILNTGTIQIGDESTGGSINVDTFINDATIEINKGEIFVSSVSTLLEATLTNNGTIHIREPAYLTVNDHLFNNDLINNMGNLFGIGEIFNQGTIVTTCFGQIQSYLTITGTPVEYEPCVPPVADDDAFTASEDSLLSVLAPGVLEGDTDVYGTSLIAILDSAPTHGAVALNSDGAFEYQPDPDYCGIDTFTYHASNGASDSNIAEVTLSVECINDPPVLDLGGPYGTGTEGGTISLTPTATDVDGDELSYEWSVGDPTCNISDPEILNPSVTCEDDGSFNLVLEVSDGTAVVSEELVLAFDNVAPTAEFGASQYTLEEGQSIALSFSNANDPGGLDTAAGFLYSYDCDGNGTFELVGTSEATHDCDYPDNGEFTPRGRIEDKDNGFSDYTVSIEVHNAAPGIVELIAPDEPVLVGSEISFTGVFNDPGILDTHTAEWNWGDGSVTSGTVTESNGSGTVDDVHTYSAVGVYPIRLVVEDKDGGSDEAVFQYVVVYDPDGGFVTGGGWIESPLGAYMADPSLAGKATFGFVSKYKRGASVPDGSTHFQFNAGDLNFLSTSYEWLVVNQGGANAMFKGVGTINGMNAGSGHPYKFHLWAGDDDPDTFRIKIWDEDDLGNETPVYDNGFEGSEYENGQPIMEGNIVIHAK
jgi:hypothetical protein